MPPTYDVFLSHASEDKAAFVEPLADALRDRGLRVWLDQAEVQLGDDLRARIDEGLRCSTFGVVVLSPRYLTYWTEAELGALVAQEAATGEKRILPVRHLLTPAEITARWPLLGGRRSVGSEEGIPAVVEAILAAVGQPVAAGPVPPRPSRLLNAPTGTQHFVDRQDELEALEAMLSEPGAAVAIEGLAGTGRTELALQLARRLAAAGRYPGGVAWLDATGSLLGQWDRIAGDLGIPGRPGAERAEAAVRALSGAARPVLVVLDEVGAWTRQERPAPLPDGPHVSLLVTTSVRRLGGAAFQHLDLGLLTPEGAAALLAAAAGRDLRTAEGVDALLAELDGHALAIELAGAWLGAFPDEQPAGYLALLRSGAAPEAEVAEQVRAETTVDQVLRTAWDRADEDLRHAWRVLAWAASAPLSQELCEASRLGRVQRRALRDRHLAQDVGEGRLRMHRLVQAWGRAQGPPPAQRAAQAALLNGCLARARAVDTRLGVRVLEAEEPHWRHVLASPELWPLLPWQAQSGLLDRVGTALLSAGRLDEARQLAEAALDVATAAAGAAHPVSGVRAANLAVLLEELGELPRARALLEQALGIEAAASGPATPRVGELRSNLGSVLLGLGELARARAEAEAAVAALGTDHPRIDVARSTLARVLAAQGDLEGARREHQAALERALAMHGPDHPTVATRRNNLAGALGQLGDLRGARALLEESLRADLRTYGPDHVQVAIARHNLALLLHRLGEVEQARAEATEALRVTRQLPEGARARVEAEAALAALLAG